MVVSYKSAVACTPLTNYFKQGVQQTSKEAYHSLEKTDTQVALFIELYRSHPEGFTDEELKHKLIIEYGLSLPNSSVSARRNDCNRSSGKSLIINGGGETRKNRTGVRALVWKLNQYVRSE